MEHEVPKQPLPKYQLSPLIASMPEHLKDPANYERIKKAIADTMVFTDTKLEKVCAHENIEAMSKCPKCTKRMLERRLLLRKLGFKNPAQLRIWHKIHTEIQQRYPLVNWKELNRERLTEDLKNQK